MAKYKKSKLTKKYSRLAIVFTILSILSLIGPLCYYLIAGFLSDTLLIQKVALGGTAVTALLITSICLFNRYTFRSKIWLLIIGLFLVIDNLLPMIIIFAVTQVLDELVLSPLAKRFRSKADKCKDTDRQFAERGI